MSAAKVMAYTVIVRHPETDAPTAVLAGKPVPAWAKDLVHDDDLVKVSDVKADPDADSSGDHAGDGSGSSGGSSDPGADSGDGSSAATEPPRAGRGSGGEAWAAYAKGLGIEIPDSASRDDVIALVDKHNQK